MEKIKCLCKLFFHHLFSRDACSYNLRARLKGFFFTIIGLLLPLVLAVNFLASSSARGTLNDLVGKEIAQKIDIYTVSIDLYFDCIICLKQKYTD